MALLVAHTPSSEVPTALLVAHTPSSEAPTALLIAHTPPSELPTERHCIQAPQEHRIDGSPSHALALADSCRRGEHRQGRRERPLPNGSNAFRAQAAYRLGGLPQLTFAERLQFRFQLLAVVGLRVAVD